MKISEIIDPSTKKKLSIFSKDGLEILKNYLKYIKGGAVTLQSTDDNELQTSINFLKNSVQPNEYLYTQVTDSEGNRKVVLDKNKLVNVLIPKELINLN